MSVTPIKKQRHANGPNGRICPTPRSSPDSARNPTARADAPCFRQVHAAAFRATSQEAEPIIAMTPVTGP